MAEMHQRALIRKIVQRLVEELEPERIILYGSYAYGELKDDSDIDMLIIQETDAPFIDRLVAAHDAVANLRSRIPFEPIVLTPVEVEERLRKGDQFVRLIVERGEVLHAA